MVSIAVASPSFCRNPLLCHELASLGARIIFNHEYREFLENQLIDFLHASACEIAIIGREPISPRVLDCCPQLRFIAKYGVGLDNLDLEAMHQRGVALGWTPGVNKRAVSELVLAFMLLHFRRISSAMNKLRQGIWHKDGGSSLAGKVVGIVGFGNIGADLALLLQPFGMELLYCDSVDRSTQADPLGVRRVAYREILAAAEVLSFHVPLTAATYRMYAAAEIAETNSSALVINTARGEVVDFSALTQAVREQRVGGFAADVFPEEPLLLMQELAEDNFYFTPHSAGNSRQAVLAMGRAAIAQIKSFISSF